MIDEIIFANGVVINVTKNATDKRPAYNSDPYPFGFNPYKRAEDWAIKERLGLLV